MNHIPSPAPNSSDDILELAIRRAGADRYPRITPDDLASNIVSEHYFTARDGADATDPGKTFHVSLGLLTFCVLVLKNGFTVTGESACASPENFNAEIGKKIARENAINKIWPLMGYELKSKLAAGAT